MRERECECLYCTLSAEDAADTFALFCVEEVEEGRECGQAESRDEQPSQTPLESEEQGSNEEEVGSICLKQRHDDRLPRAAPTMHFYPNGENGIMGVILPAPPGYYDDIEIPFEE